MFFNEKLLREAISSIDFTDETDKAVLFYNDLVDKKYTIVFHFEVREDCLFYEAFVKDKSQIKTNVDYIPLKVNFVNPIDFTIDEFGNRKLSLALAWYIFNQDENKAIGDPEYYNKKYHFIPENLRNIANLSDEEREAFIDSRHSFIELINYIEKNDLTAENAGDNWLHEYIRVKPKTIFKHIPDHTFEYDVKDANGNIVDHILISPTPKFFKAIDNNRGKIIIVNNSEFKVAEDIVEGSIYIDEFNKIILNPTLRFIEQRRFFYDKEKTFVEVNIVRKTVRIIKFKTLTQATFYYFCTQNRTLRIDYIKDILEAKFGSNFTKMFQLKTSEENDSRKLRIKYYVELKITNSLNFSTVFILNNKEYKREELMKSYYYADLVQRFENVLLELQLPANSNHSNINVLDFLTRDLSSLKNVADIILDDSIKEMKIIKNPGITFNVRKKNDWFEIDPVSESYTQEEIDKIFKSLKEKNNYVVIHDDIIDLNHLESKDDLKIIYGFMNNYQREIPMHELFKLESLKNHTSIDIEYDGELKDVLYEIKNYKDIKVDLSEKMASNLRPYQLEAVQWMTAIFKNGLSGILADDMGLGKTLETIAFLETLKEDEPILIVSPKSVTYNWLFEFNKWNSTRNCVVIEGSKDQRDSIICNIRNDRTAYITSYDTLRNDIDILRRFNFNMIILDESQYIKNATAMKTIAAKQINAKYKLSLTGTPIENGLSDLWSIFDFIMPGYLNDYNSFMLEYKDAFEKETENKSLMDKLLAKITPFIFKRSKNEVLTDFPEKTTSTITLSLTDEQQDIYSSYLRKTKLMLINNLSEARFRVIQGIMRLRQICVDPSSFLLNYKETPAKITFTLDMVKEYLLRGSKILIYSSFVSVLERLQKELEDSGYASYQITGSVSASERNKRANAFNNQDDIKIMLVSLKAGGVGLNLTGADTVLILDPWWNMAAEEQAADRAYRIGQTRPVNVFKLIAHNTIEEKIIELQERKKDIYDKLIAGSPDAISNISDEDIKFILS